MTIQLPPALPRRALLAATLAFPGIARAQDFPSRPIRIVVPFPAGGPVDIMVRIAAEALTPRLGQRVVVENRSGAAGNIAAEHVARGPADGATLLQCPMGTMTIGPEMPGANLPIDPRTELIAAANLSLIHISRI